MGDIAPDFTTKTESGDTVTLSSLRGRRVVLYFYPKDDTPACTAEACSIRDSYAVFQSNGVTVFGVSGGTTSSHQRFKEKYGLPFPLLMDEDFAISKLYGVYVKKKMYGKEYMGIERVTFLIDENGKIEGIFGGPAGTEKVNPERHAEQVAKYWKLTL